MNDFFDFDKGQYLRELEKQKLKNLKKGKKENKYITKVISLHIEHDAELIKILNNYCINRQLSFKIKEELKNLLIKKEKSQIEEINNELKEIKQLIKNIKIVNNVNSFDIERNNNSNNVNNNIEEIKIDNSGLSLNDMMNLSKNNNNDNNDGFF